MITGPPNVASLLVGPLAAPECRRALARGWLILVRLLAGLALLGATLIVLWTWWMSATSDPGFTPYGLLRYGLMTLTGMMLTIALVLGPAVLAGSIAGEKERGVMALLLTTAVTPREIVLGRLIGKLTQVAMVLLVGVPAVVALASLAGMSAATVTLLLALPAAVAIGGGGLAVLASTLSRRGSHALLTVYLIDVFFLATPIGWWFGGFSSVISSYVAGAFNPFLCLAELVHEERYGLSLSAVLVWLGMGLAAASLAAWRLRSACLRPLDGERQLGRDKRWRRLPDVYERRPMLWKERFIERAAALGGVGWWLAAILVVLLAGGSLVLAGLSLWGDRVGIDPAVARHLMSRTIGDWRLMMVVGWLIQGAVGLRAAVTISSERERGTWDALMTSPLQGREIVWSKLLGSLNALRWLLIAALLSWTIAAVGDAFDVLLAPLQGEKALDRWTIAAFCKAFAWLNYAEVVITTFLTAAFMAAVGVRASLSASTATRAMSLTVGIWLGAKIFVWVASWILLLFAFAAMLLTISMATMGTSIAPPRWLFAFLDYQWAVSDAVFALLTLLLVADTGLRFDRLAGRMTAGRLATAVDALVHGKPEDPWGQPLEEAELQELNSLAPTARP